MPWYKYFSVSKLSLATWVTSGMAGETNIRLLCNFNLNLRKVKARRSFSKQNSDAECCGVSPHLLSSKSLHVFLAFWVVLTKSGHRFIILFIWLLFCLMKCTVLSIHSTIIHVEEVLFFRRRCKGNGYLRSRALLSKWIGPRLNGHCGLKMLKKNNDLLCAQYMLQPRAQCIKITAIHFGCHYTF